MKPFGHTEARDGRDTQITPVDERLDTILHGQLERWEDFISYHERSTYFRGDLWQHGLSPSQHELEQLILRTPMTDETVSDALGIFVSVGLSLLPDTAIIYSLHTPLLNYLGFELKKDLIITGTLGDGAGANLYGVLTNHGTLGDFAGMGMYGLFVNYGEAKEVAGFMMIGALMNYGLFGDGWGSEMFGFVTNQGTCGENTKDRFVGRYENAGKTIWRNFKGKKAQFLNDIITPSMIDMENLYQKLTNTYRRNT
jgi:hypothetical protein